MPEFYPEDFCTWSRFYDWNTFYNTSCGELWCDDSISGQRHAPSLTFCPYCGRLIQIVEKENKNGTI